MKSVLYLKNPFGDGENHLCPIEEPINLSRIRNTIEEKFGKKLVSGFSFHYVNFPLGHVVVASAALWLVKEHKEEIDKAVEEHRWCNWGESISEKSWQVNFDALTNGGRIISHWTIAGHEVWIVTDAKDKNGVRAATTIMLPSDS